MRLPSSFALCLLAACSSTPERTDEPGSSNRHVQPSTEYYVGEVTMLSPDGNMALGPARPTVAKWVMFPDQRKIEEWVWDDGELTRVTMIRAQDNMFAVSEDKGRFAGSMRAAGEPWSWTSWTYSLRMTDGSGKLWGTGEKTDTGLSTNRKLMSLDGEVRVQIQDRLTLVEEQAFEARLAELKAAHEARTVPNKPEPGSPETVPAG